MAKKTKAAIDIDKIMDSPVGDLSAAEFLEVLNHPKCRDKCPGMISDKKKFELWIEETEVVKISVRELLGKLQGEKKKLELEPFIDIGTRGQPGELFRQSELQYSRLVDDVARRIEDRLGRP